MHKIRTMARYRSIIALVVAVLATFAISFSSLAATSKAATYTQAQIEQIQQYVPQIEQQRDRLEKLQTLIQNKKWVDVSAFVHGPMGEFRRQLNSLAAKLSPEDRKAARDLGTQLNNALVRIDQVAKDGNYQQAVANYREALKDFDSFIQLIPQG